MIERVDIEDLDLSDDCSQLIRDGEPFSGVVFERSRSGVMIYEGKYVDGRRCGVSRFWSEGGVLSAEQCFLFNGLHGLSREWYPNGSMKSVGMYELGVCISLEEWAEDGVLASRYVLEMNTPQHGMLENFRASALGRAAHDFALRNPPSEGSA